MKNRNILPFSLGGHICLNPYGGVALIPGPVLVPAGTLISQREAAYMVGVEPATIRYWERHGWLSVAHENAPQHGRGRPSRLYHLTNILIAAKDRGRNLSQDDNCIMTPNFLRINSVNGSPVVDYYRLSGLVCSRVLTSCGELFAESAAHNSQWKILVSEEVASQTQVGQWLSLVSRGQNV